MNSVVPRTNRRPYKYGVVAVVAAVAAVVSVATVVSVVAKTTVSSAASLQTPPLWDGAYSEAQARRGEPLYEQSCAECHGADLNGVEMAPGLA